MIDPVPHYPLPLLHGGDYVDVVVTLSDIAPSPTNLRRDFPADYIYELAKSIEQQGILQPILLRPWPDHYGPPPREERQEWKLRPAPRYEIVSGECRYRAALQAGLEEIPAHVRAMSDRRVAAVQLIENIQRRQLDAIEEATGFKRLIDEAGLRAEDIPQHLGKGWSRSYVYSRLKLLDACPEVQEALRAGRIATAVALKIARIPGAALQKAALAELLKTDHWGETMSVRRAESFLRARYTLSLVETSFPTDDADLLPAAGSCADCRKRSGNCADLYDDIHEPNICTDPDCYAQKRQAWADKVAAVAAQEGKRVIRGEEALKVLNRYGMPIDDYVAPDMRDFADPERRSVRELAEEAGVEVPVVLVQEPGQVRLVEMVDKTAMAQALEAAGVQVPPMLKPKQPAPSAAETQAKIAEQEKARQEERARRERLAEGVRDQLRRRLALAGTQLGGIIIWSGDHAGVDLPLAALRAIAERVLSGLGYGESDAILRIRERLGLAAGDRDKPPYWADARDEMREHVPLISSPSLLLQVIMDCVIEPAIDGRSERLASTLDEIAAGYDVGTSSRATLAAESTAEDSGPAPLRAAEKHSPPSTSCAGAGWEGAAGGGATNCARVDAARAAGDDAKDGEECAAVAANEKPDGEASAGGFPGEEMNSAADAANESAAAAVPGVITIGARVQVVAGHFRYPGRTGEVVRQNMCGSWYVRLDPKGRESEGKVVLVVDFLGGEPALQVISAADAANEKAGDTAADETAESTPATDAEAPSAASPGAAADPLYAQAVEVVTETGQASAGILQRRLHVRRERCVALLHALEANGVVSVVMANGKREVLK